MDVALLQVLGEKWWDTTHTFIFEKLGEMTLTPKDFSSISGIPVHGNPLKMDRRIHKNIEQLTKLVGQPLATIGRRRVKLSWLYTAYRNMQLRNIEDHDILTRVFILALLGCTLFARSNKMVHLYYLPCLASIGDIGSFNWGGAALAFMYQQMDDLCRHNTHCMGGLWKAWKVWAREYLPCVRVTPQSISSKVFPRSLLWSNCPPPTMGIAALLKYYREKLTNLTLDEVDLCPWGDEEIQPYYVALNEVANSSRILLVGPNGAEWYLGERVSMQSCGIVPNRIPQLPPKSMLVREKLVIITKPWCLSGKSASEFWEEQTKENCEKYKREVLCTITHHKVQWTGEDSESDFKRDN
ncbi:protein MAINTENANCE OF MERISTEMS-like [Humulus lupulus]|uniref:protein MAINTENANCE OF MERISTEMS-like n=1 Tax=Humulus lupulus TaxID=3486 RepID=UPI002B414ED7|nr:protein MAINTENANCE OF MERISTEMS-like [Humulus lupulus]